MKAEILKAFDNVLMALNNIDVKGKPNCRNMAYSIEAIEDIKRAIASIEFMDAQKAEE